MSFDFTADEVFEMAEHLERDGAQFYRAAAEVVSDEKMKDLFYTLSDWEIRHEKIFSGLRKELSGKEKGQVTFDPNSESSRYLKSLVEGMVSFSHTLKAESAEEILKASIESERDAVKFYTAMRDAVPESLGKAKIDKIISEEASHVKVLSDQLGKLIGHRGDVEIDTHIPEEKKPAAKQHLKDIACVGEEGSIYEKSQFKESPEHDKIEVWGEDGIDSDSVIVDED